MPMVTEIPNKYHPSIPWLLQITHKQVYYTGCKKQCEDIVIDLTTLNLFSYPPFSYIIFKKT